MALRLKCVHVGMLYEWYVAENRVFTCGISQHFIPMAQKEKSE